MEGQYAERFEGPGTTLPAILPCGSSDDLIGMINLISVTAVWWRDDGFRADLVLAAGCVRRPRMLLECRGSRGEKQDCARLMFGLVRRDDRECLPDGGGQLGLRTISKNAFQPLLEGLEVVVSQ